MDASFLGLGATPTVGHDDSDDSSLVIPEDSDDDDPIHDDDIDLGFRRYQYETYEDEDGNKNRKKSRKRSRQETKEDALYGVFGGNDRWKRDKGTRFVPGEAPLFVAASKPESNNLTEDAPPIFVAPQKSEPEEEAPGFAHQNDDSQKTFSEVQKHDGPAESADEEEINKQKDADEYFQSLLQQAQLKRRRRLREEDKAASQPEKPPPSMPVPSFGRGSGHANDSFDIPAKSKDPHIAKWEKHEKGIGSKLLFKMGWKGSGGLGSNRRKRLSTIDGPSVAAPAAVAAPSEDPPAKKGISKPVEVVVRPANLGLGFGNFKEQSQLKTNRQIEAEVRGILLPKEKKKRGVLDPPEEEESDTDSVGPSKGGTSSAIPTTSELMKQKAWKKRKTKRQAPRIIPYEELMAQHGKQSSGGPVIIDMRGPSASSAGTGSSHKDGIVPLGEELLHNVTFMLNTHENQLHSYSQIVKSTQRKEASLQSEIEGLKQQKQETEERRRKLEDTLKLVDRVDDLVHGVQDNGCELERVIEWVQELGKSFTAEDKSALKFWQTLAPALLSPILQAKLENWDLLGPIKETKAFLDSLFLIHLPDAGQEDEEALKELRHSIIQGQLLPRIKAELESSRWDPCSQTDIALDMYEYLLNLAARVKPGDSKENDVPEDQVLSGGTFDGDKADELSEMFRKELILDTIYPKLQRILNHWKPSLGKDESLDQRLERWILPWIPHLDHPAILSNLLSDCKRKLKTSLSYLQRKLGKNDELALVRATTDMLKYWVGVYEPIILHRLVSEFVSPYLARAIRRRKPTIDISRQDWSALNAAFEMHGASLLSNDEFLSILEAELLSVWSAGLNEALASKKISTLEAVNSYCDFKKILFLQTRWSVSSCKLLRNDPSTCGILYTVLCMIKLSRDSKYEEIDALYPPSMNYHVVAGRRAKERQIHVQDSFVKLDSRSKSEAEARLRLRRRQIDTPSFRDVIEELAQERGVLFQPRIGARALKDGKQVFLFGDTPIYIEDDVIFASRGSSIWEPISLDSLVDGAGGEA